MLETEAIERMSRDAFEDDPGMWLDLVLEGKDANLDVEVEISDQKEEDARKWVGKHK